MSNHLRNLRLRKEVLGLYREIIRTSRLFTWKNEKGDKWSNLLRKNARNEIEDNKLEKDPENIARLLYVGWEKIAEIQDKLIEKQKRFEDSVNNSRIPTKK